MHEVGGNWVSLGGLRGGVVIVAAADLHSPPAGGKQPCGTQCRALRKTLCGCMRTGTAQKKEEQQGKGLGEDGQGGAEERGMKRKDKIKGDEGEQQKKRTERKKNHSIIMAQDRSGGGRISMSSRSNMKHGNMSRRSTRSS